MKNCALLLFVSACIFIVACKQHEVVDTDILKCPADPAPLKGLGGKGSIIFPNAFSPNGDGRNDVLKIVASDTAAIRLMSMRIMSASGDILYTLSRPQDYWDGYDPATKKPYPAGKYRVDYGIVLNGGGGTDVVLNGSICIKLYASGSGGCLILQGDHSGDVFEDQIDPATGSAPYTTGEQFCP
jgi:gliding motility-associated-like protein